MFKCVRGRFIYGWARRGKEEVILTLHSMSSLGLDKVLVMGRYDVGYLMYWEMIMNSRVVLLDLAQIVPLLTIIG